MLNHIKAMFKPKPSPVTPPSYTFIYRNKELDFHIYINTTDKNKYELMRDVGKTAVQTYNNKKE